MALFELYFVKFRSDENAAVTVDWVVITAIIVTLGIAAMSVISPALVSTTDGIASTISAGLT